MKKLLSGKKWTAAGIAVLFVILIGTVILGACFYSAFNFSESVTMFLDGEYSIDGGEWQPIDNETPINDQFEKIVFRGTLTPDAYAVFNNINISAKNVWFTLRTEDGEELESHVYHSRQDVIDAAYAYHEEVYDPGDPMHDKAYFDEHFPLDFSFERIMPETPGYTTHMIYVDFLKTLGVDNNTVLELEVDNPYPFSRQRFSECFSVSLSEANGFYLTFYFEVLPTAVLFLLVCFFGIFLFPVAGFILGKINYKYIIFGVLCFFWGLFMIGHRVSGYLNLWITDPTVCMAIEQALNYCLVIMILFYLKSQLKGLVTRLIANIAATMYLLLFIGAIVLHFTVIADLYETTQLIYLYTATCTVLLTVLLFIELRYNRQAIIVIASWTPLTLSLITDAVNHYIGFSDIHFYHFGLAVTMLYQIAQLVLDMKKQYRESIRYQQMQKELYEAKVGVMVSQIQPHFMYNALTSIAMMCSIDPDTAQEATVTFAKYLRGNMDSLKQTAPVPFEQELEHLKKYLYIEKLRFGKKLNIEYDIQVTDFVLPQLSIQPLAENAVKHGVGMKKQGGTVTIATRETADAFEVIISDDGVGFDTAAPKKDDGRSHVGMENTQRRLKDMCGGEVIITSKVGEGTVATVRLPKEGQNHENTVS